MRHTGTQASHMGDDKPFVTMQRLLLENTRLRRICTQSKEMATRYELLLREGDHRIKNSLQVVTSLLGLQERRETSAVARDALRAATARIQAIARIHDALQLNGGKDVVNLGALIATMCQSLHAMAGDPSSVKITVNVEPIEAPLEIAQPIVLAVNELVINALRHAFPDGRHGAVSVTVALNDGRLRITVADDGAGLPANYLDGHGYGMNLVRAMIAKVAGSLDTQSVAGAHFILSAPLSLPAATPSRFVAESRQLMGVC